jgi:hypothetical protein
MNSKSRRRQEFDSTLREARRMKPAKSKHMLDTAQFLPFIAKSAYTDLLFLQD